METATTLARKGASERLLASGFDAVAACGHPYVLSAEALERRANGTR
jgi:hypothetical protein